MKTTPGADQAFWESVRNRIAHASGPAVVEERWPAGAGMVSWYVLRHPDDVEEIKAHVRPGSALTAYFELDLPVSGMWSSDLETGAAALLEQLGPNQELLFLVERADGPLVDSDYITDPQEFIAWQEVALGRHVWIGRYPDLAHADVNSISAVVPDMDGVIRAHPY